jgi:hypothetical protein
VDILVLNRFWDSEVETVSKRLDDWKREFLFIGRVDGSYTSLFIKAFLYNLSLFQLLVVAVEHV